MWPGSGFPLFFYFHPWFIPGGGNRLMEATYNMYVNG